MTSERRIVVSLSDIKLISYECKYCGARVSFSPDCVIDAADQCFQCKKSWAVSQPSERDIIATQHFTAASPERKACMAISAMRNQDVTRSLGFRILLELEEPSTPSGAQTSKQGQ